MLWFPYSHAHTFKLKSTVPQPIILIPDTLHVLPNLRQEVREARREQGAPEGGPGTAHAGRARRLGHMPNLLQGLQPLHQQESQPELHGATSSEGKSLALALLLIGFNWSIKAFTIKW